MRDVRSIGAARRLVARRGLAIVLRMKPSNAFRMALGIAAGAMLLTSAPIQAGSSKPTIVLVHGAWADGSSWDKVAPLLMAKGYDVVAVHEPLSSLGDDVAAVKRVIDAQPGDVVLVG